MVLDDVKGAKDDGDTHMDTTIHIYSIDSISIHINAIDSTRLDYKRAE